jgi:Family of unknown function (DUF6506)
MENAMKFAYIYAMPGYETESIQEIKTKGATFISVAVDINKPETAADVARKLVNEYGVEMIELCGGLANAKIVAKVKEAIHDAVPVGAVYYGPESRRPLVNLLKL